MGNSATTWNASYAINTYAVTAEAKNTDTEATDAGGEVSINNEVEVEHFTKFKMDDKNNVLFSKDFEAASIEYVKQITVKPKAGYHFAG